VRFALALLLLIATYAAGCAAVPLVGPWGLAATPPSWVVGYWIATYVAAGPIVPPYRVGGRRGT